MPIMPDRWRDIFALDAPLLEIIVRGAVMYLLVFVLLRSSLRRTAGELTMLDFVFVLLVAVGAENAMLGTQSSVAAAAILVATLIACNYLLNILSYYIPFVEKLVMPPPLPVVKEGKMLRRNMRREFLTEQELMGKLREQGVDDVQNVKAAYIEGDGTISVIPREAA
jgi:uncharacterized membrane protein YcaP (DUF421 family)